MADYIYLLENRLSAAQKRALGTVRDVVKAKGQTLFLVGGAVRDLTSGSPVRDLDVAVQGNVPKLRKELELAGALVAGTQDAAQILFVTFPGGVRMEIGSTMSVSYPKPGKPVHKPSTILDDLRRRDFTANAMALSLNDGSYGLLMDPLNGVADIENRELRLVSNYGFIEDPVRMIRAMRFAARLGWELEEKTKARYETGKAEGYISALGEFARGYEAEEIVHEEDPLRVMRRLESEGWLEVLAPAWGSAKANTVELEKVRESQTQLQLQGISPDPSALNFPLLTAKMAAKDVEALKKSFARHGFVAEIGALEAEAKEFATQLGSKGAATPSAAYRLIKSAKPESVLYVAYTTKSGSLQAKFKSFFSEWQQARQKIPNALMLEMRITPELPGYAELVEKLFFELMDGNLGTVEEMRAFLEPYSPPAPPPPVHLRRARATKKDAKGKGRTKKGAAAASDADEEDSDSEDGEDAVLAVEDEDPDEDSDEFAEVAELAGGQSDREEEAGADVEEDDEVDDDPAPSKPSRPAPVKKAAPSIAKADKVPMVVAVPAKAAAVSKPAVPAKAGPVKTVAVKAATAKAVAVKKPSKTLPVKAVAPPAKAIAAKGKTIAVKSPGVKAAAAKYPAGKTQPQKPKVVAIPAKAVKAAAKRSR